MSYTITGMQSTGVQAVAKHFIAYEQETQRNPTLPTASSPIEILSYSANLGDRAMHELYLHPFATAVKAGVSSVSQIIEQELQCGLMHELRYCLLTTFTYNCLDTLKTTSQPCFNSEVIQKRRTNVSQVMCGYNRVNG